jgi:hypothetical protein
MSKLCILMIGIIVGVLKRPQHHAWSIPPRPPWVPEVFCVEEAERCQRYKRAHRF